MEEQKRKIAYPMSCADCGKEIEIEVDYPQTEDEWKRIQGNINKKGRCAACEAQYNNDNYCDYEYD